MILLDYDSYRNPMRSDLLMGLEPSGDWQLATIHRSNSLPSALVPFDKAVSSNSRQAGYTSSSMIPDSHAS